MELSFDVWSGKKLNQYLTSSLCINHRVKEGELRQGISASYQSRA